MPSDTALLAPQEHQPGDVIAHRYVLGRKLGEGGMGVVWVAHSTALDVDVALKMLKPELAGTPAVERMAREARAAAQLGHPAMVRVLDFGTSEQGEPFLAMELLQGEELHTRLQREQRLAPPDAIALLLPIIDGLGIAHEKGIVHRDIKPENVFIATDGQRRVQPKVLDFGIAKLGQEQAVTRLTQVGAVMGSPFYLSPEQAEGIDDIDFRCDIWSTGVVLYEAITGVPPFMAGNYNALMRSILRDEPKPTTEHGVGDEQLWMIIGRCLKKDREQRWGSIWELGEALALWMFERGVRVDAAGRSLKHAWLDGAVTGLQILVPSELPSQTPTLAPVLVKDEVPTPSRRAPLPSSLAQTQVRARRKRRAGSPMWLALGFGLLGAAGALWFVRSKTPAKAAVPAATEVRPRAAVSALVEPASAVEPSVEATAAVEAPSVSSAPPSAAPSSPPKAGKTPKAKPNVTSRPSTPSRHTSEFGF